MVNHLRTFGCCLTTQGYKVCITGGTDHGQYHRSVVHCGLWCLLVVWAGQWMAFPNFGFLLAQQCLVDLLSLVMSRSSVSNRSLRRCHHRPQHTLALQPLPQQLDYGGASCGTDQNCRPVGDLRHPVRFVIVRLCYGHITSSLLYSG